MWSRRLPRGVFTVKEITTVDFGMSMRNDAGAGLPSTGAEVVDVVMSAVAALGLGWLLVVTTRRRRMV